MFPGPDKHSIFVVKCLWYKKKNGNCRAIKGKDNDILVVIPASIDKNKKCKTMSHLNNEKISVVIFLVLPFFA